MKKSKYLSHLHGINQKMILFLGGALCINRLGQKISKKQASDSALSLRLCGLKWSFILMKTAHLLAFINFE